MRKDTIGMEQAARLVPLSAQTIRRCIDRGWLKGGRKDWLTHNGKRTTGKFRYTTAQALLDFCLVYALPVSQKLRKLCK